MLVLVLNRVVKGWRTPAWEWIAAEARPAVLFEDRFTNA